jgi:MFS transporter, DHA1 family, multidrug resistance protein
MSQSRLTSLTRKFRIGPKDNISLRITAVIEPLRQNEALAILCATQLAQMTSMGIVTPVLPLYAAQFGVGAALVGMVVSAFGTARLLVNLPAGQLSERFGRRRLLVLGTALSTVGVFLCGLATDYPMLVAFRFISGLGSGIFTTAAMVYIADVTTAQNRGRSMSMFQGSLLLGTSIGPALGGLVAEAMGFQAPFFVAGVCNLGALVWAFFRIPDLRAVQPESASRSTPTRKPANELSPWHIVLQPNFLLVCFVSFGIFLSRSGARMTVMPLLAHRDMDLSEAQLGLVFTGMALLNLVAVPLAGSLCDRYGRKAAIVPSTIMAGIGHIMMGISPSIGPQASSGLWLFLASAGVIGIATGIGGPSPAAYAADIAPEGGRGLTLGLFRTFSDLAMVAGPVFLGWVAEVSSFAWALYFDAGIVLAGAVLFGLFAAETLQRSPVPR